MTSAKIDLHCDLLIVGGGLVGMTAAIAADHVGLTSILVDRSPLADYTTLDFDGRVTSLAYGSHAMLDVLGVWDYIAEAEPIADIRVSDEGAPLFLHFDHRDVGDRPFGFMVENRHLRLALQRRLLECDRVTVLAPGEANGIERSVNGVRAELSDGRNIAARLLLAADGQFSSLREAAGIRCLSWRYKQTAIVCVVTHEVPHDGVAKEHFLPAGPFALLPMTNNRSAVVWSEREELAPAMMALEAAAFDDEINARAGNYWGRLQVVGPRWSYPLGLQNAERYIDRRLALIGDAAHSMHPIAGQGLNLAMRDVACLMELLDKQLDLGLDPGDGVMLAAYQRWRRFDALGMLVMTDALNRLFSTDITPIKLARGLGLGMVNRIGPLKRSFERHAAALSGDLPKLIRGEPLAR